MVSMGRRWKGFNAFSILPLVYYYPKIKNKSRPNPVTRVTFGTEFTIYAFFMCANN